MIDCNGFTMKDVGLGFSGWTDFEQTIDMHSVAAKRAGCVFGQGNRSK
jgi:hypothetical protein